MPTAEYEALYKLLFCDSAEKIVQAMSADWLEDIFPGIKLCVGCNQGKDCHLEGDVAMHTALVFENILQVCLQDLGRPADFIERLAALIHDWKKPPLRTQDANGKVSFKGHEQAAAQEIPALEIRIGLSKEEAEKLSFLVTQHGATSKFPQLPQETKDELRCSPHWNSLCALHKADALSCHLPGGTHLPVHWDEMRTS